MDNDEKRDSSRVVWWHSLHWIPHIYSADTTGANRTLLGKMTFRLWRRDLALSASQPWFVSESTPRGSVTQGPCLCSSRNASTRTLLTADVDLAQRLLLATQITTSCWGSHCTAIKSYFSPHLTGCRRISAKPRWLAPGVSLLYKILNRGFPSACCPCAMTESSSRRTCASNISDVGQPRFGSPWHTFINVMQCRAVLYKLYFYQILHSLSKEVWFEFSNKTPRAAFISYGKCARREEYRPYRKLLGTWIYHSWHVDTPPLTLRKV